LREAAPARHGGDPHRAAPAAYRRGRLTRVPRASRPPHAPAGPARARLPARPLHERTAPPLGIRAARRDVPRRAQGPPHLHPEHGHRSRRARRDRRQRHRLSARVLVAPVLRPRGARARARSVVAELPGGVPVLPGPETLAGPAPHLRRLHQVDAPQLTAAPRPRTAAPRLERLPLALELELGAEGPLTYAEGLPTRRPCR